MQAHTSERDAHREICALVNDWGFFRDQGHWEELAGTFHEDGRISISWVDAPHVDFVAVSKLAALSGELRVKHQLGVPRIQIRGERALSEVNVTILVRAKLGGAEVDVTSYCRFLDRVTRRDGVWKILWRTGVYERDRADPVGAPALPDGLLAGLDAFPSELRFLGRTFQQLGLDLSPSVVCHGAPQMAALYEGAALWLATR